jgi:hypothetical protein
MSGFKTRIYVLKDPRNKRVRYVGKTFHGLDRRLKQHMDEAFAYGSTEFRSEKCKWIRELYDNGHYPLIEEIDSCYEGWMELEAQWIVHFRNMYSDLTNVQFIVPGHLGSVEYKEKDKESSLLDKIFPDTPEGNLCRQKFNEAEKLFEIRGSKPRLAEMVKLYSIIYKADKRGLTLRDLKRLIARFDSDKIWNEILNAYCAFGLVYLLEIRTGGRERNAYVHCDYIEIYRPDFS